MLETKPILIIFAGANGSGKTTAAEFLLRDAQVREFLNADEMARGLSPFAPDAQRIKAGRLLLSRMEELLNHRRSFAFETTLSGSSHLNFLEKAKALGYEILLYYFYTETVELNIERIKTRVSQGGHDVPEVDVKRRYSRSLRNLRQRYWPLCDTIIILRNENDLTPMAMKSPNGAVQIYDEENWNFLLKQVNGEND